MTASSPTSLREQQHPMIRQLANIIEAVWQKHLTIRRVLEKAFGDAWAARYMTPRQRAT